MMIHFDKSKDATRNTVMVACSEKRIDFSEEVYTLTDVNTRKDLWNFSWAINNSYEAWNALDLLLKREDLI